MTNPNELTKLLSYTAIRNYCAEIEMTECRVHWVDPNDNYDPWSEEAYAQVFNAEDLISFLQSDNLYEQGHETLCHGLVMFNANGYVEDILTA